jgi:hypothetical protein
VLSDREACSAITRGTLRVMRAQVRSYLLIPAVTDKSSHGVKIDWAGSAFFTHRWETSLNFPAMLLFQPSKLEIR